MRRITFSEVVGEIESDKGPSEVWAVAEAAFDEGRSQLIILFSSSLRAIDGPDVLFPAQWLPDREALRKVIPINRAFNYANDLFHAWADKVRQTVEIAKTANETATAGTWKV
jgi:hypothetical protein